MELARELALVGEGADPTLFANIGRHLDPDWIADALEAHGVATLRKRRLPVEQVVWLVLGIALFRGRSIQDVVAKLDLALPAPGRPTVTDGAITKARARLGAAPLQTLFERTAAVWSERATADHRWHGLTLFAVDGSSLAVADTPANREAFGGGANQHGAGAQPMLRLVALVALYPRLIAGLSVGRFGHGEATLAEAIWPLVPDDSLTILDKLYLHAAALYRLAEHGRARHWLLRARTNVKFRVVTALGVDDALVAMATSSVARRSEPALARTWTARAITYVRPNGQRGMLPPFAVDRDHRGRGEHEGCYDELKTDVLDHATPLRSGTPEGVLQEFWAVGLAYNLVRLEMAAAAVIARVEPRRISFVMALGMIRDEWLWSAIASPGAIPKRLRELRAHVARFVLPPRRERSYPRVVKRPYARYPVKRRPVVSEAPK